MYVTDLIASTVGRSVIFCSVIRPTVVGGEMNGVAVGVPKSESFGKSEDDAENIAEECELDLLPLTDNMVDS